MAILIFFFRKYLLIYVNVWSISCPIWNSRYFPHAWKISIGMQLQQYTVSISICPLCTIYLCKSKILKSYSDISLYIPCKYTHYKLGINIYMYIVVHYVLNTWLKQRFRSELSWVLFYEHLFLCKYFIFLSHNYFVNILWKPSYTHTHTHTQTYLYKLNTYTQHICSTYNIYKCTIAYFMWNP